LVSDRHAGLKQDDFLKKRGGGGIVTLGVLNGGWRARLRYSAVDAIWKTECQPDFGVWQIKSDTWEVRKTRMDRDLQGV